MEKRNSQRVQDTQWSKQEAIFARRARCQSQHQRCFDVRSVLQGQVSMSAVYQMCVIHEAKNGFKNLKSACFENVKYTCMCLEMKSNTYIR